MVLKSIDDLQNDIRKFVDERDWDQFHNLKDLLISLNLESSEALELVQWKSSDDLEKIPKESLRLGEELADVLYWTLLIANKAHIDLTAAFIKKMEQNSKKYPIHLSKGSNRKYSEL